MRAEGNQGTCPYLPLSIGRYGLAWICCLALGAVGCSSHDDEPSWVVETIEAKPDDARKPKVASKKEKQQHSSTASYAGQGDASPQSAAGLWVDVDKDAVRYIADARGGVPLLPKEQMDDEFFRPFRPGQYRVSVGDVLEISIFGHRDTMNQSVPVAPDGKLYYFFIEGIPAEGRTVEEIEHDIESRLGNLFTTPDVSIIPRRVMSSKYTILGKVKGPGNYYIQSATTLRQAIGQAGGFAEGGYRGTSINIASLKKSFIIRDGKRLPIDFEELMKTEDADNDIYVRPGDYIYIASSLIEEVYRLGALKEPRPMPYEDGLTLVGLVTGQSGVGGGYLPEAHIQQVLVIRGALEDPQVTVVNLEAVLEGRENDVYLQSGDIVYVPYKPYRWLRQLIRVAIFSYARAFGGAAGFYYGEELFEEMNRND